MKLSDHDMLLKAATVAARVHQHQLRKDDTPYVAHCIRVAIRCDTKLEKAVALLHDTVEDSDTTLDDLRDLDFSQEVLDAVDALSRRAGETYSDFIERVSKNELARKVKLADIADNLEDTSALDPEEAEFFKTRYGKALEKLNGN